MKITNAKLFIRQGGGKWEEIRGVRSIEMGEITPRIDAAEPVYYPPQSFEVECTITWRWWAPFAFSLPPAGCVPMFN